MTAGFLPWFWEQLEQSCAARRRGLKTVQLPTFDVPAGLHGDHVHCGPDFADAVAATLGIATLQAPPGWLAVLPREFTKRDVKLVSLGEAPPAPIADVHQVPNDKNFRARSMPTAPGCPAPMHSIQTRPVGAGAAV